MGDVLFVKDADERVEIVHESGDAPNVLDETLDAVRRLGLLHVWSGRLVRLYRLETPREGRIHRPQGSLLIHPVEAAHYAELATRAARHLKYDARQGAHKEKEIDFPLRLAAMTLARGYFPTFPVLDGVTEGPTLAPDGRPLVAPGYDSASRLYVAGIPEGWQPLPAVLTKSDGTAAAELLLDAIKTFPTVSSADEVAAVAEIITAPIRRSLDACPMFAHSAPTPGTGKSLLTDLVSVIALGRRASVMTAGHDEAESEKRLAAMMLAGDAIIAYDNVPPSSGLDFPMLNQACSQPSVRMRPLGGSTAVSVPTTTLLVATGNNLSVRGDMRRRTVLIRLDAGVERPETRRFKGDLLASAMKRRAELLRAALIVPLAYMAAGEPELPELPPYGGFSAWDRFVRRPLVWLGLPDPLAAAERLREDDPDLESARDLLHAIREVFGGRPATVTEIVKAALEQDGLSVDFSAANPALKEAVSIACSEKITGRRLGGWLKRHRDRIVDGLQLVQGPPDSHTKSASWLVRRIE